jgi:hypothetical protein
MTRFAGEDRETTHECAADTEDVNVHKACVRGGKAVTRGNERGIPTPAARARSGTL